MMGAEKDRNVPVDRSTTILRILSPYLADTLQLSSLAKIRLANKAAYSVATPYLYPRVAVRTDSADGLLGLGKKNNPILDLSAVIDQYSPESAVDGQSARAPSGGYVPVNHGLDHLSSSSYMASIPFISEQYSRRAINLRFVKTMIIHSLPCSSANSFLLMTTWPSRLQGDLRKRLMPNLETLVLYPEAIAPPPGTNRDLQLHPFFQALSVSCAPKHICISFKDDPPRQPIRRYSFGPRHIQEWLKSCDSSWRSDQSMMGTSEPEPASGRSEPAPPEGLQASSVPTTPLEEVEPQIPTRSGVGEGELCPRGRGDGEPPAKSRKVGGPSRRGICFTSRLKTMSLHGHVGGSGGISIPTLPGVEHQVFFEGLGDEDALKRQASNASIGAYSYHMSTPDRIRPPPTMRLQRATTIRYAIEGTFPSDYDPKPCRPGCKGICNDRNVEVQGQDRRLREPLGSWEIVGSHNGLLGMPGAPSHHSEDAVYQDRVEAERRWMEQKVMGGIESHYARGWVEGAKETVQARVRFAESGARVRCTGCGQYSSG